MATYAADYFTNYRFAFAAVAKLFLLFYYLVPLLVFNLGARKLLDFPFVLTLLLAIFAP